MLVHLTGVIRSYAWGSHTSIADFLGAPSPAEDPQAELWFGAHPSGSSLVSTGETVGSLIAADPEAQLGARSIGEHGRRLPFLLKVLAPAAPLSLQAHPDREQARAGFTAEQRSGRPLDAPDRTYRDPYAKPEMLCALAPTEALCGFRSVPRTVEMLTELAAPPLLSWVRTLSARPSGAALREIVTHLLAMPAAAQAPLVTEVADSCRERPPTARFAPEYAVIRRLAAAHPADVGVVVAVLLNYVRLEPGEAIYLPAGNLHTYLSGFGIEAQANSDNTLRGGLTPKHIDVPELLRLLDFSDADATIIDPDRIRAGLESWPCPAREFRLDRATVTAAMPVVLEDGAGPSILLVTGGTLTASTAGASVELQRGQAAYRPAADPPVTLSGQGVAFVVTINPG